MPGSQRCRMQPAWGQMPGSAETCVTGHAVFGLLCHGLLRHVSRTPASRAGMDEKVEGDGSLVCRCWGAVVPGPRER